MLAAYCFHFISLNFVKKKKKKEKKVIHCCAVVCKKNRTVNEIHLSIIYLLMKIEDSNGVTLVAQSGMNLFTINDKLCKWIYKMYI